MAETKTVKKNITTATGREFKTDYFNASENLGRLSMRLLETTLVDVASVFSNPAETVNLTFGGRTVMDYTKLVYISPEGDAIRVTLRKE